MTATILVGLVLVIPWTRELRATSSRKRVERKKRDATEKGIPRIVSSFRPTGESAGGGCVVEDNVHRDAENMS